MLDLLHELQQVGARSHQRLLGGLHQVTRVDRVGEWHAQPFVALELLVDVLAQLRTRAFGVLVPDRVTDRVVAGRVPRHEGQHRLKDLDVPVVLFVHARLQGGCARPSYRVLA